MGFGSSGSRAQKGQQVRAMGVFPSLRTSCCPTSPLFVLIYVGDAHWPLSGHLLGSRRWLLSMAPRVPPCQPWRLPVCPLPTQLGSSRGQGPCLLHLNPLGRVQSGLYWSRTHVRADTPGFESWFQIQSACLQRMHVFPRCVTLDKLLTLSEPPFSHLESKDGYNSNLLMGWLCDLN